MFLLLCIPTRAFLATYAKDAKPDRLKKMGQLALVPALGMMYLFLTNSRQTGIETQGSRIWWADMRPVFSLLYFGFAYLAINKDKNAYKFLAIDVIFGLTVFLVNHYNAD